MLQLMFQPTIGVCMKKSKVLIGILTLLLSSTLHAGDRLLATGGVAQVEGSGGGGLVPWALITGYGTKDQVGASTFYTQARTRGGFEMGIYGVGVGFNNRVEVSLSQLHFDLGNTVPGETIRLNTLGIKTRLFGDAVYDQDSWMPQVSAGIHIKHNEDMFIPSALGAKKSTGVDVYLAATKLFLNAVAGRNLLVNFTVQATKANQFGLLGFGGDNADHYKIQPAMSVGLMLTDNFVLGFEYRAKPNNLSAFKEEDAKDIFIAWFPVRNLSLTAAYIDLGNIANKENQYGYWLSGQYSY